MRRIVVSLVVAAAACAAVAVAFLAVVAWIELQYDARFPQGQQTQHQIEEAQRISQIVYSLTLACGPLVAAALVAVVVILALLAFRWELRRAPAR